MQHEWPAVTYYNQPDVSPDPFQRYLIIVTLFMALDGENMVWPCETRHCTVTCILHTYYVKNIKENLVLVPQVHCYP